MKHYKTEEVIVELIGSEFPEYKFVFGSPMRDALSKINGGITGNGSALVKAHVAPDRTSDYVYANIRRVSNFKVVVEAVPAEYKLLIDEIKAFDTPEDELTEEQQDKIIRVNNYFELD